MKKFLNRFMIVLSLLFVWSGTKAMMASGGVTRLVEDAPQMVKISLTNPLSNQKVVDLDDNNKVIEMNQGEFDVYDCVQGHRIQITHYGKLSGKKLIKAIVTKDGEDPVTVTEYPITVVADKNMTIDMDFGYVAEFKVRGDGGTISCTRDDYVDGESKISDVKNGDRFYIELSPIFSFTATPDNGYKVKAWYLNGKKQEITTNNYQIEFASESFLVEVEFEKSGTAVEEKTVNVNFVTSGIQSVSLRDLTSGKDIEITDNAAKLVVGHEIQLDAEPNVGFKFSEGKIESTETTNITDMPFEFVVANHDIAITLKYIKPLPVLTFGVKNSEGGTLKAERIYTDSGYPALQTLKSGDSYDPTATENITFTATPEEGYSVKGWYKDGVLVEGQTDVKFVVNQLSTSFNVEVEFSSDKPSVETTLVTFGAKNNVGGKVEGRSDGFRFNSGDELESGSTYEFTAIPDEGYEFKAWFVNNVKQDETGDVLTIENPTTGFNVEALFEKPGVSPGEPTTITLTVDAPDAASYTVKDGEKTIEFVDNVATVASGHLLTVTAVAKDGKEFKEGSVSETETRHLIGDYFLQLPHEFTTIEKDMTIQLFFKDSPKEEKTVNLTIKAPDADSYTIMDGEKKIEFVDNVAKVVVGHKLSVDAVAKEGKDFVEGSVFVAGAEDAVKVFNVLPAEVEVLANDMTIDLKFVDKAVNPNTTVKLTMFAQGAQSYSVMDGETKVEFVDNVATVTIGHTLTIDGVANDGKVFIKGTVANSNNPDEVISEFSVIPANVKVLDQDMNINLKFGTLLHFGVKKNANGTLGCNMISKDGKSTAVESGVEFDPEKIASFVFTAAPNEGYVVKGWYVNDELQASLENTLTIASPNKSLDVFVEYGLKSSEPIESVSMNFRAFGLTDFVLKDITEDKTISIENYGHVDVSTGHKLQLSVTAISGADLIEAYLKEDDADKVAIQSFPFEFTVGEKNFTIQVNYARIVKFGVKDAGGDSSVQGSIKAIMTDEYDDKEEMNNLDSFMDPKQIEFIATPNEGYKVKAWYKDGKVMEGETGESLVFESPKASLKVEVEFVKTTSVEAVEGNLNVYTADNNIMIEAPAGVSYRVYDLNGTAVATGIVKDALTKINVSAGAYIVSVSGKVFKVMTK